MNENKIQPILCARNTQPAALSKSFPKFQGKEMSLKYDWVIFLVSGITNTGKNEYRCSYTICESKESSLVASDVAGFSSDDKEGLSKYMATPINLFKKSELDVFLFDKQERTSDEVTRMVREWSKNKTTKN